MEAVFLIRRWFNTAVMLIRKAEAKPNGKANQEQCNAEATDTAGRPKPHPGDANQQWITGRLKPDLADHSSSTSLVIIVAFIVFSIDCGRWVFCGNSSPHCCLVGRRYHGILAGLAINSGCPQLTFEAATVLPGTACGKSILVDALSVERVPAQKCFDR